MGPVSGPLVVGRVTGIEELAEFKKPIRACTVDVGEDADRDIVCGATNFGVGDLVVVALPGATLPGDFHIATRKTYGRTSDGMICSAAELGLGQTIPASWSCRREPPNREPTPARSSGWTTSSSTSR